MRKLILLTLMIASVAGIASAGNLSKVLENLNCTEITEQDAVPDFIQGPIIAMALVPESGKMKMNPGGERIGKISEDVIVLGEETYGVREVCSARDSKGHAIMALYCVQIALIVYDAPDKMQEDYGCKYVLQVIGLDDDHKSYKIITK